ncbi:hypothetical protein P170DRAFT_497687 [Aspergillus steynii IBT 23096]|uniref:Uncharacterized protein n=1 Tax=Aspergillus steynii IBT 23096 TaxID=1392250 RepID=A0A2I2G653_9EURO|nr:uncharacterized protein P170DRAFT_497687 [Aspergillus steynii IBT 23096]PLB48355.1 hypothetical protein P170DRAFT_497687 [Aspergillus steynii IBT 23096]
MSTRSNMISLHDIIHHHRKLLVNPLLWTSRHLDALRCRFQHIGDAPTDDKALRQSNDKQSSPTKQQSRMGGAEMLANSAVPSVKYHIMCRFLLHQGSLFNKHRWGHTVDMLYRDHLHLVVIVKDPNSFSLANPFIPHYTVFYRRNRPSQPSQSFQPLIGYLDYVDVTGFRMKKLAPCTHLGKGHNAFNTRLYLQERVLKSSPATSHTSRLLVVNRDDFDFAYLYEGNFTCEFLKMLDSPMAATCINAPVIHCLETFQSDYELRFLLPIQRV